MHFAAHSQVGESMQNPAIYYESNVVGSLTLLSLLVRRGIKHFVFSSTAAVYGEAGARKRRGNNVIGNPKSR